MISERQRQTDAFYRAITSAIDQVSGAEEQPMLNAIFGALVAVESGLLARIDPRSRDVLCAALERQRPEMLQRAISKNQMGTITVIPMIGRGGE